jgi:hypothetical protein
MNKVFLLIALAASPLWAQYSNPIVGSLSYATIKIPVDESFQMSGPLSDCQISLNRKYGLKQIAGNYIRNTQMLNQHLRSCFSRQGLRNFDELIPLSVFGWSVNFKFSFARASYLNTDINVNGTELNGRIHNFNFAERTSQDFYDPGNWQTVQNAFQWIDEPTNYFVLSFKKEKNHIIISMFHPKWTIGTNTNNRVTGELNGVQVDEYMNLDEPFEEDYSNFETAPGELHLVVFENTHLQLEFSLGYGRDFTLFTSKKGHELNFQPAIYIGLLTGANLAVTRNHENYWEFNSYKAPFQVQGPMVGFGTQIQYDFGLFDVFYQARYTAAAINERGAWGGTLNYTHQYVTQTAGIGIDLYRTKKPRKKPLF